VAGPRAALLTKKREAEQAKFESRKQQIRSDSIRERQELTSKFDADSSLSEKEQTFRQRTVGLVSAEEFKLAASGKQTQKDLDQEVHDQKRALENLQEASKLKEKERKKQIKKKKKAKKFISAKLSFSDDVTSYTENSENKECAVKSIKSIKNPNVDTSFLPDKARELEARKEREKLRFEWNELQSQIKKQALEITYSYWDGSGHRRTVQCKKGDTIGSFLELVRKDLASEFREMGNVSADALLYVKEDLIIPQDITFYDLISSKARGKSGPLFQFDVHDDIRLGVVDVRVEKDESHPGKIVERRWYDRNKHIFPASRWEVFDPAKVYGRYTIHGGEVSTAK